MASLLYDDCNPSKKRFRVYYKLNGKKCSKSWGIITYGYDEALRLAQEFKEQMNIIEKEAWKHKHIFHENHVEIILKPNPHKAISFLIDHCDFDMVINRHWHAYAAKKDKTVYIKCSSNREPLHRILLNPAKNQIIDHIDGNGLNNTRNNLRIASYSDNNRNQQIGIRNKSGCVGVHYDPLDKAWIASYYYNNKPKRKRFGIATYGYEEARQLAIDYRLNIASSLGYIVDRNLSSSTTIESYMHLK